MESKRRILVLEDKSPDALFLKSVLDRVLVRGEVTFVLKAAEATRHLEVNSLPAMIVLELHLPVMDGIPALDQIASHSPHRSHDRLYGGGRSGRNTTCLRNGSQRRLGEAIQS